MGYSHSWIAVQGLTREQALEALVMDVSDVQADLFEGIALFDWSDDWLIVLSDDHQDALQGQLAELGTLGRVAVACGVSEEAVYSAAAGYEAGEHVWSVTVNPNKQVFRVVGYPPEQLDTLLGAAKAAQTEGTDLFSTIPLVLAESICGFALEGDLSAIRHVSLKPTGDRRLEPNARASGKPSFFARLFGRS